MQTAIGARRGLLAILLLVGSAGCGAATEVTSGATVPASHDEDAVGYRFGAADTDWAFSFADLAQRSTLVVVASVKESGKAIGFADPRSLRARAIYRQDVVVDQVLKSRDEGRGPSAGETLSVLGVGPNVADPKIEAAVQSGRVYLSDNGLGNLAAGQYVLFLRPSAVSQDPDVDFSGTYVLSFAYQSALQLAETGELSRPGAILGVAPGQPELTAETRQLLLDQYEMRPEFEIPSTLEELAKVLAEIPDPPPTTYVAPVDPPETDSELPESSTTEVQP